MSSAYLDMRDPMVAVNGQRPTAGQVSPSRTWGFFAASILVGAPWVALNTIAMPNAIARTFGYDTAVAGHIAINPATGRPLPVATELAMPLAVLVIVGVVASMFAMPLDFSVVRPHTHAIGPSYPVDGWRRSAVRAWSR